MLSSQKSQMVWRYSVTIYDLAPSTMVGEEENERKYIGKNMEVSLKEWTVMTENTWMSMKKVWRSLGHYYDIYTFKFYMF